MKKLIMAVAVVGLLLCQGGFCEEEQNLEKLIVKGTIEEIAKDSSYIVVADTKIITDEEFLKSYTLEVGNETQIITIKTDKGLAAFDMIAGKPGM